LAANQVKGECSGFTKLVLDATYWWKMAWANKRLVQIFLPKIVCTYLLFKHLGFRFTFVRLKEYVMKYSYELELQQFHQNVASNTSFLKAENLPPTSSAPK